MTKLHAWAFPILPGKTEQCKKFTNTLRTEKYNEFKASRERLGVRERSYLQQTPMGDSIVVTLEGEDPQGAFDKFGAGTDAFTTWFKKEVSEIHGIDLGNPPKITDELVVDSGQLKTVMA